MVDKKIKCSPHLNLINQWEEITKHINAYFKKRKNNV